MLIGAATLAGAGRKRTRGQSMTRLATVCAETAVKPTATLLHGKCTLITPNTIQIHGLGTIGRELVARSGREGEGTGVRARRRLGGRLGAGAGCSNLVLLDRNGSRMVNMR